MPEKELYDYKVLEGDLWKFKESKTINRNFEQFMKYQIKRATHYKDKGELLLKELYHKLDGDCKFILSLLLDLYKRTLDKIENSGFNVFIGKHELDHYEIFKTTFHNAWLHSFGKKKIFRLGLSLLSKYLLSRIEKIEPASLLKSANKI